MSRLKRQLSYIAALACMSLLAACGSGSGNPSTGVRTYKHAGSLQCTGGGATLEQMQQQLSGGGVTVLSAVCGVDGMMYPAVCGASDGRIGIFEIPSEQLSQAAVLGFQPLSTLPDAVQVPCQ